MARITANSRFKTAAEVAEHMATLARDPQFKIETGTTREEYMAQIARKPAVQGQEPCEGAPCP